MSKAEILTKALKLPEKDRRELAGKLWDSLEEEPTDPEWRAAWAEELERRSSAYESGEEKSEDAFKAVERIRKSLLKKKKS